MKANVKEKALVWLACVFIFSGFSGSQDFVLGTLVKEDSQKQDVSLTPMDPAVCKTQNITFRCSVGQNTKKKSQIQFLAGLHSLEPVKFSRQINKNIAEFTIVNVSQADNFLAVCCCLSKCSAGRCDTPECNSCSSEPSILNVYNLVTRSYTGTLRPIDPDVCTTQDITFTCTLLSPPERNYSIGFAVKNESTNLQFVAVESRLITMVSETVSELTIYNINVTTSDYIFVRCYYWKTFGDTKDSVQLDDTSTILVFNPMKVLKALSEQYGSRKVCADAQSDLYQYLVAKPKTMPKKIEAINCVVKNHESTMNCTWNYGIEYDIQPDVTFLWRVPVISKSWTDCPNLNPMYGYCYWNSTLSGYFSMKIIDINIVIQRKECGVELSSNFTIDTRNIVKPDPVVALKSAALNSTCIEVSWQTNRLNRSREHKLIVFSQWGDHMEVKFNTTGKLTHRRILCGLYPYTEYTFTVSVQPTGNQSGFYSDPRTTNAKTYSNIPSSSPEVTKGGYSWYQRDCEENSRSRRVCVFWQPISMKEKNGPMKGLKGEFTAVNKAQTVTEKNWAEDLTYGCSSGLLCNTSYMFTIKARNENGTSKNVSKLKISSSLSGILQPHFIVESANTSDVYVSWTYPEIAETESFLLVWCKNKNGDCESHQEVNWINVSPDSRDAVLKIAPSNSSNSAQGFLYGVSAITEHGSSGVEWQDCVYLKDKVPKRKIENVVVMAGSNDNTLVVTWDKLTCKSDEPYIAMYNVQYNKLSDETKKSQNVSASGEARLVLGDLEEDQTYVVTVRAISKDGHYGPESQAQTGTPVNKSLKPGAIVGITVAVLLVVIFAAVGCVFVIWKCKKKAAETYEDNTRITIPGLDDSRPAADETLQNHSTSDRASMTSIERQNSDDSGIYRLTPQPERFEGPPNFGDNAVETVRPDDYVVVTTNQDSFEDTGLHAAIVNITNTSSIAPNQRVATVSLSLLGDRMASSETFVKEPFTKTGIDETSLKSRMKNVSGDYGVSDAYSKAVMGILEESITSESNDDGEENNNASESTFNCDETPEYLVGDNGTHISSGKILPHNQTEIHGIIPKPMAFSEHSNSECSLSDMENETVLDTGAEPSSDYFKAQMEATSSPNSQSGYDQSHPINIEPEPKSQIIANISALTKIPCPMHDENDTSSIEEEIQSTNMLALLDSMETSSAHKNSNNYESLQNNDTPVSQSTSSVMNTSVIQGNSNEARTDNMTEAITPNKLDSFQLPPQPEQANTDIDTCTRVSSLASTSLSETYLLPVQLSPSSYQVPSNNSISQPENQTINQNTNNSQVCLTSVPVPCFLTTTQALSNSTQVASPVIQNTTSSDLQVHACSAAASKSSASDVCLPHSSAAKSSVLSNDKQKGIALSSEPNSVADQDYTPHQGYMPHSSVIQGYMPSVPTENSTCISPSDAVRSIPSSRSESCVQHPSSAQNEVTMSSASESGNSLPSQNDSKQFFEDTPCHVSSPDLLTSPLSIYDRDRNFEPDFIISSRDNSEYQSTGSMPGTGNGYINHLKLSNQLSTPLSDASVSATDHSNCQGYVDETFAKTQPKKSEQNVNIAETNEQTNGLENTEMPQTNEYVAHQFLSQGMNDERLGSYDREPLAFELRNVISQENVEW